MVFPQSLTVWCARNCLSPTPSHGQPPKVICVGMCREGQISKQLIPISRDTVSTVPSGRRKRMNIPGSGLTLKAKECSPLCWLQCDSVSGNKGNLCLATERLLSTSPHAAHSKLWAWAPRKAVLGYNVTELIDYNEIILGYHLCVFDNSMTIQLAVM